MNSFCLTRPAADSATADEFPTGVLASKFCGVSTSGFGKAEPLRPVLAVGQNLQQPFRQKYVMQ